MMDHLLTTADGADNLRAKFVVAYRSRSWSLSIPEHLPNDQRRDGGQGQPGDGDDREEASKICPRHDAERNGDKADCCRVALDD